MRRSVPFKEPIRVLTINLWQYYRLSKEPLPRIDYSDTDFASLGAVQGADPRSNDQSVAVLPIIAAVLPIIPRPSNISSQDQAKQAYPQNHGHQQQHR